MLTATVLLLSASVLVNPSLAREGAYRAKPPSVGSVLLEVYEWESESTLADASLIVDGKPLRTDPLGRTRVVLPPADEGQTHLSVGCAGWSVTHVFFTPSSEHQLVRVPLSRGARVRGRVVAADGNPVEGASVRIEPPPPPEWFTPEALLEDGRVSAKAFTLLLGARSLGGRELPDGMAVLPSVDHCTTDANGAYELEGIPYSDVARAVHVRSPRHLPAELEVVLAKNSGLVTHDVQLDQGAALVGRILRDGRPIEAELRWQSEDASGSVRTDASGEYRLSGLPPGVVELRAAPIVQDFATLWFTDLPSPRLTRGDRVELVIDLPAPIPSALFRGRVTDREGRPLAGVRVRASQPSAFLCAQESYFSDTVADGSFSIEIPVRRLDERFTVSASKGVLNERVHDLTPGSHGLRFELPVVARRELQPQERGSDRAVQLSAVLWRPTGTASYRRLTGASQLARPDGETPLELPLGPNDLVLVPETRELAPRRLHAVLFEHELPKLAVAFAPGASFELWFADDAGLQRPPDTRLWLVPETEYDRLGPGFSKLASLVESADGRWVSRSQGSARVRFRGLGPGRYVLHAPDATLRFEPRIVSVPADGPIHVRWTPLPQ